MPLLTPSEVQSMLKAEKEDALGVTSATLADDRRRALDYYFGDMQQDLPSLEGRSSAVSTDVSDTVEGLMPPLMEIFAAGEQVVEFQPVGAEDEQAAAQESDYVNHVFMQKNPGFVILYSFIKDALLSKLGIVKVIWDEYEISERETYENVDEITLMGLKAMVAQSDEVEIVSVERTAA